MCSTIMDIIVWQKVKNTEKSPSPFINVDTIIVLFSSAYSYFFCYNIDKGGRRDILGLFEIFATYYVHDCSSSSSSSSNRYLLWIAH